MMQYRPGPAATLSSRDGQSESESESESESDSESAYR